VPINIENFAEAKRIKLFERLSIVACALGVIHFFPDVAMGSKEAPVFDLTLSVVTGAGYLFHRKGFHTLSRVLVLCFLNLYLTVYACVMDQEVGIYLFFLPLMTLTIAVFGSRHRILRLSFTIFSATLLLLLFVTDFDLIGPMQFESFNAETFYKINLISCALTLVMCLNFIVSVNEESEKQLHTLANEIKIKNTNLEKTNAELDRFLYSTSHDLRSPLLSIKGLVNITRNETINPPVQKYLSMIEERANRLDSFIKDIIDYSRNTRTELNVEPVDMHQLVHEVEQNFQFLEGASEIDFQNEMMAAEVPVDRQRTAIVLNNLISNAIKYHRLKDNTPWIRTSISRANGSLCIVVADNGQGICAERKERIFDMFYRGTEKSQGSGLGLYIVKEAIQKMKGTIRVESVEGAGTSFFVTIPLQETHMTASSGQSNHLVVSRKDFTAEAV
jgi:signal transduction histidine kinase